MLIELGNWARRQDHLTQVLIDDKLVGMNEGYTSQGSRESLDLSLSERPVSSQ